MNASDNFEGYTEPEIRRWLHLRAIEWSGWPEFISQPLIPVLLIFIPFWHIAAALAAAVTVWEFTKYSTVSPRLVNSGCILVAHLKWPATIGSAIYLLIQHRYGAATTALLWPILANVIPIPVRLLFALCGRPSNFVLVETELSRRIGHLSATTE